MILISVAMFVEAKPLIEYFHLKQNTTHRNFKIWENSNIRLIVTGTGKTASAIGTTYLATIEKNSPNNLFFNIGITPHNNFETGALILAHKVTDSATNKNFYPCLLFSIPFSTATILSIDNIEKKYDEFCLYDMEAAGFCQAASTFTSWEKIQCVKIISDNHFDNGSFEKEIFSLIEKKCHDIKRLFEKTFFAAQKTKT